MLNLVRLIEKTSHYVRVSRWSYYNVGRVHKVRLYIYESVIFHMYEVLEDFKEANLGTFSIVSSKNR